MPRATRFMRPLALHPYDRRASLADRYLPNLLTGLPMPVQKSQPAPAR
jgi:hypothetical protein